MEEKKVSILNKFNEKLVGIETAPSNKKEKYPTIVLVHGFGVKKEEGGMFDELAKSLAEENFLIYRFDFSGRGESEGDYSKTSLSKQKSDLSEILKFIKSSPKVNSSKIGILAQSFGTCVTVALMPKVKTIILMGSVANALEILKRNTRWEKLDTKGVSKKIKSSGEVILIDKQFWEDLENYNLPNAIKKIGCP